MKSTRALDHISKQCVVSSVFSLDIKIYGSKQTNWKQKQYFIIVNHYSNYHLHCQFIFFFDKNFYITICVRTSIQKWKRSDLLSLYLLHFGMLPCSNFDSSSPIFRELKWLSLFAAKDSAIYTTTWLTTNKKKNSYSLITFKYIFLWEIKALKQYPLITTEVWIVLDAISKTCASPLTRLSRHIEIIKSVSWCLETPVKHSHLCLIYYFTYTCIYMCSLVLQI